MESVKVTLFIKYLGGDSSEIEFEAEDVNKADQIIAKKKIQLDNAIKKGTNIEVAGSNKMTTIITNKICEYTFIFPEVRK